MRPHRWQPTRLPHPWDSPGKNTGVGCHFLLQCRKVKSESEVSQSCPTLQPHGLQPTRLLRPWDFPGKRTGVGGHCLRSYQTESVIWGNCNKEESNSCIQEGNGKSPCEYNWQIIVLVIHKDIHWNHSACLGYTSFPFTSHIHLTTGRGLFPCRQAGVKALLITILPAKKWISPSIYSGNEKLFAFRRDYKMESFYSWHLQSQLLLLGQLKIHAPCLWQKNIFYKLLANTSQRGFILRSMWD